MFCNPSGRPAQSKHEVSQPRFQGVVTEHGRVRVYIQHPNLSLQAFARRLKPRSHRTSRRRLGRREAETTTGPWFWLSLLPTAQSPSGLGCGPQAGEHRLATLISTGPGRSCTLTKRTEGQWHMTAVPRGKGIQDYKTREQTGPLAHTGQFRIPEKQSLTELSLGKEGRGAGGLAVQPRGCLRRARQSNRRASHDPEAPATCPARAARARPTGRPCSQILPPGRRNIPLLE